MPSGIRVGEPLDGVPRRADRRARPTPGESAPLLASPRMTGRDGRPRPRPGADRAGRRHDRRPRWRGRASTRRACGRCDEVCAPIDGERSAALLVAEEALDDDGVRRVWRRRSTQQEQWSDLPIVLLAGAAFSESSDRTGRLLGPLRNVMVLERPVRVGVLVTAMRVALRARRRQYRAARRAGAPRAGRGRSRAHARVRAEGAARRRGRQPAEGRVPGDGLARAADAGQRRSSAGRACCARNAVDEQQRQHAIDVIHRNAHAQAHVIEELLDVSRIITGKLRHGHGHGRPGAAARRTRSKPSGRRPRPRS